MPPKGEKTKKKDRPKRAASKPPKLLDHVPGLENIAKPKPKRRRKQAKSAPTLPTQLEEETEQNQFEFQNATQVGRQGRSQKVMNFRWQSRRLI